MRPTRLKVTLTADTQDFQKKLVELQRKSGRRAHLDQDAIVALVAILAIVVLAALGAVLAVTR